MKTSRFEELLVWQKSRELALAVYRQTGDGRFVRDWGLRDQVRRAAVSVMSNIAEGFGRYSRAEFRRFASIALGSAAEVQSQLYLARDLGYLSEADHRAIDAQCVETIRMLVSLRISLEASSRSQHSAQRR
jgi:four helix bundle protein